MPRPANPDKVKVFKVPPAKSDYYTECLENCNKEHCPNLHYLKCKTPGCSFIAQNAEQHSKAADALKKHMDSQKCQIFQANAVITGNTINTLTVINKDTDYQQLNGSLSIIQKQNEKAMTKTLNAVVEQTKMIHEAHRDHNQTLINQLKWTQEQNGRLQQQINLYHDLLITVALELNPNQIGRAHV
mgnify:CR=1 FL=1